MLLHSTGKINSHWWETNFPCRQACPVQTEAGRYVSLIGQGRHEDAYRVARRSNPLASICGRICAAPCEEACTRGTIDSALSIRALKRFACERYGVESMLDLASVQDILSERLRSTGKWVAVIGSGPAGLAAAHDLALLGHQVSLFEAQDVLGGMLTLGIPEYRLPRELIRQEINVIINMGIDVHLGKKLGVDFSLADFWENGYNAIFLALGAHGGRELRIDGIHADGVIQGLDFLLNANRGYRVKMGEKILVIGGGNVAFDVARTAARRVGKEERQVSDMVSALDVARSAIRFGAKQVEMICLESEDEIPADVEEIEDASQEGIRIHYSRGPKRVLTRQGKVTGLEVLSVSSVFDEQGRFSPSFVEGSEATLETDSIICAIGQEPDLSFLTPELELQLGPNRTIQVDPTTLTTSEPGIWAGGDLAFGPRNVIHAVADGKRAAASIHQYLLNSAPSTRHHARIFVPDTFSYRQALDFDRLPPQKVPKLPLNRRTGIAQVELGFDEDRARCEGKRCLRCWINTVFEGREEKGSECVLCGGCEDICPEKCIEILPGRAVSGEEALMQELSAAKIHGGKSRQSSVVGPGAVIIKDETRCIRCGLCAKRCPVGCITMQALFIEETADVQ